MWNLFGDFDSPHGTYYYGGSSTNNTFWNIYDQVIIRPGLRKRFVDEVEKHGVKCEIGVYYFDIERDVCVQRVIQRNKDRTQINIPIDVVYSFSERLIVPTLDEGFAFIKIVREGKVVEVITNE